jgi:hypothetical protein
MPTCFRGIVPRVLAATLATAVIAAPLPAYAGPSEIERLYVEGQDRYAADDFVGAADSWTRLLEKMPEAQSNKATRENVLLNVVQAYIDAYNRSRREDGSKDIEHLRKGKEVLDKYYADYNKAYGDRAAVSQAVQEKSDDLDAELRKAEEDIKAREAKADGGETETPIVTDPTDPTPPPRPEVLLAPQGTGNGLIVGGSVVGVLGIGALAMGIIGAVRGPKAEDDFNNATTELERQEANFDGEQANKLTIAGFVLAPLLLGGGAAMLTLGIMRKQKANRQAARVGWTPSVSRTFTGITLQGRF